MTRLRAYLRSLDPQLPRAIWMLELGTFVNFFGSGLAFPFLLIYLHNVRGFGYGTAGLVVATLGVVGVVAGPDGRAADRPRRRPAHARACALLVAAFGYGLMPLVHEPWQAFLAAIVIGIGERDVLAERVRAC